MYVLGIESSCDETAAAVVTDKKEILSNIIYSQITEHKQFGGVVPEIAARAHLDKIDTVVNAALSNAQVSLDDIDAVAGTCGPGLIGGIIVGSVFAKTLAMTKNIPFIAVNHIEAHALSARLTSDIQFPYLLFLMSGGHCQICIMHDIDRFEIIGSTLDDSIGESFDKVSKMLGFGYPGGPIIETNAKIGNRDRFDLPRPICRAKSCDFSFSGLKTAVRAISSRHNLTSEDKIDLCASFQQAIVDILSYKVTHAIQLCRDKQIAVSCVVIAGGVAANQSIRQLFVDTCGKYNMHFCVPPVWLCTDNGAMIAWIGVEKMLKGQSYSLNFAPKPVWPLGA